MGLTGEFNKLPNKQRLKAIEVFTREAKKRGIIVFANATGDDEKQTLNNIQKIEPYKPDYIVLAPLYYLRTNREILRHFRKIKTNLPIVLYNNSAIAKIKGRN